jgi:glycine/D-amino acid oxidase-like deaminating enzyme
MSNTTDVEIAIIGTGIAGIAVAYYLCTQYGKQSVMLIDSRPPMSFTSAQSGDNYRNWWPHPTMVEFSDHSIDLMERIALDSSNQLCMTRGGYAVATRRTDITELIADLHTGYGGDHADLIREHNSPQSHAYQPADSEAWQSAPNGVDILSERSLIQHVFPSFSPDIANVLHIRRAGDISSQQLAQYMLERIRAVGARRKKANVLAIEKTGRFVLDIDGSDGVQRLHADVVVNAAGPFAAKVAAMLGIELPIENVFQQKVAFEDRDAVLPRQLPFSIDIDVRELDWTAEERSFLGEDPATAWLTQPISGGTHCRPEGGRTGQWVKLGWAYNRSISEPQDEWANDPHFDPQFPEIVMRGAAALNPALSQYIESFPPRWSHYGGYYPMTRENWPLIGPLGIDGAFIAGALSGFGSMSACAAGSLCAAWIADGELPAYALPLSLARYDDPELMAEIGTAANKGIL